MHNSVFRHARIPVAIVAAAGVVALGSALAPAVASAHVSANAPGLAQGGYGVITFRVPNESDTNAATTEVTVTLPNLKSARTEPMPGWRAVVSKDATTEEATSVTWTATPGSPGIAVGEFGQFVLSAGPLPKEETVKFPAVQKYSDGETVDWNQPPNADGSEADHPAPEIELAAATDDEDGDSTATTASSDTSDTTARWLGGAGLVVGVLGIAAAGVAIRRKP
ncbi:YcnI family protein [Williamsia sp.]|uniref:YcnI family copper-binding membrane protein n=1 Tax=Williamsia sp. TaxID=1872085 RepID=UPI001A1A64DE|nr:YcnI family protein [Williamsia sp.]MBJ7288512.1 YcnI family protein [Williamsia sp.]